jgi:hypothetical protein
MAEADQDMVVVSGLHQLSQHPAIDVALQSSIFSRSEAVIVDPATAAEGTHPPVGLHSRTVHYIDGDVLLEHLSNSADMLVESMVRSAAVPLTVLNMLSV